MRCDLCDHPHDYEYGDSLQRHKQAKHGDAYQQELERQRRERAAARVREIRAVERAARIVEKHVIPKTKAPKALAALRLLVTYALIAVKRSY